MVDGRGVRVVHDQPMQALRDSRCAIDAAGSSIATRSSAFAVEAACTWITVRDTCTDRCPAFSHHALASSARNRPTPVCTHPQGQRRHLRYDRVVGKILLEEEVLRGYVRRSSVDLDRRVLATTTLPQAEGSLRREGGEPGDE